jgi:phosphoglycerate dehydrogenase-like enzyme
MVAPRLHVATAIGAPWRHTVLDTAVRRRLAELGSVLDLDPETLTPVAPVAASPAGALDRVTALITGWGAPELTGEVLDRFRALEVVVHAAGSVRGIVTDEVWRRGVRVSSASAANARAVADFTVAQVQLSLKNAWALAARARQQAGPVERTGVRGQDGARIGLVGLGHIGTLVAGRLVAAGLDVVAYDPVVDLPPAGVVLASLEDVFGTSDVVSLHAPLTPVTERMVGAALLDRLPPGATFVNTARGGLVDHTALAAMLRRRPDVTALLDVTDPEPLPAGHELFTLPNTFLTPHVAGSLGTEEARLGELVADELTRWASGLPLEHGVPETRLASTA